MKIYSSNSKGKKLDQFVGKDIWVKVYLEEFSEKTYVRLTNKTEDEYWFNAYLDNDGDIDEILEGELTSGFDEIKLVRPLDTITTEELIDLVEHRYDGLY